MATQEEEFDNEMEELKDALQHKSVRAILWRQMNGDRLIFSKYLSTDTDKVMKWKGERDLAIDMFSNVLTADLELGLQMIRENWNEGEEE